MWYNKQVVKSDAGMAQSVEHVIGNDEVISSILITSSKSHAKAWDFSFCKNILIKGIDKFFGGGV